MKKLLGIIVLGLFLSSNAYAISLRCENKNPKAIFDFATVDVDLSKRLLKYKWLGGYMKITSVTDERVKAVLKIPTMSINWYATLNRFSGDLTVYNDVDARRTEHYNCKKVDKLF